MLSDTTFKPTDAFKTFNYSIRLYFAILNNFLLYCIIKIRKVFFETLSKTSYFGKAYKM